MRLAAIEVVDDAALEMVESCSDEVEEVELLREWFWRVCCGAAVRSFLDDEDDGRRAEDEDEDDEDEEDIFGVDDGGEALAEEDGDEAEGRVLGGCSSGIPSFVLSLSLLKRVRTFLVKAASSATWTITSK